MNKLFSILTCLLIVGSGCLTAVAAESEPFRSLTDVGPYETPTRYNSGTTTYNLGPTGARGWFREFNGGELFWAPNGREILIVHVDPGSPADGKLQVFDVLVGADGKTFDQDATVCLGNAIAKAQRGNGRLPLNVWRQGRTINITLDLPRLPGDTIDGPIVAAESEALREQFLAFVAQSMHPDGFRMHPSYASLNALYLLANEKPEHLDLVRRHIRRIIENMPGPDSEYGPWNWVKGSQTTLLAEYFLLTGDRSVLPALDQNLKWMRSSQSYAGGFGHGGPYGGYGHVGLPGMFCAVGATLARECGVTGYDDVIEGAQQFYARPAGLGMVGYGGYNAGTGLKTMYGDNGKSGSAAVFFDVLGDKKTSRMFADNAGALAAYSQSGHTGHFWSFSWGAMGANRGATPYRKHFAREMDWYYATARTWRGGMTAQPWLANMGSYAPGGAEQSTGGYALWYCMPLKSLRILGGEKSVLSAELTGPLADARQLIDDKQYEQCLATLAQFRPTDDQQRRQAEQLKAIAERQLKTIELTLASIRANIDKGELYTAERQVNALKPILADPDRVQGFEQLLGTDRSLAIIEAGKTYHNAMTWQGYGDREFYYRAPGIVVDAKKRAEMQELADSDEAGRYAEMAADALKRWPFDPTPEFTTLVEDEVGATSESKLYLSADADAEQGVRYRYYEFDTAPEDVRAIRDMKPVKEGTAKGFDISARKRRNNFAFAFRTFVDIETEGDYTFTLTSDDGSVLSVNGEELIDNGGVHGMTPKTGTVRLTPGRHELECLMFQGGGGMGLQVEMAKQRTDLQTEPRKIAFTIDNPAEIEKLKVRVNAADPVAVYLNGQIICRFHEKRKKHMLDSSWEQWERVTLRPEALELLRAGENTLGVVTAQPTQLGAAAATVGVQLQATRR